MDFASDAKLSPRAPPKSGSTSSASLTAANIFESAAPAAVPFRGKCAAPGSCADLVESAAPADVPFVSKFAAAGCRAAPEAPATINFERVAPAAVSLLGECVAPGAALRESPATLVLVFGRRRWTPAAPSACCCTRLPGVVSSILVSTRRCTSANDAAAALHLLTTGLIDELTARDRPAKKGKSSANLAVPSSDPAIESSHCAVLSSMPFANDLSTSVASSRVVERLNASKSRDSMPRRTCPEFLRIVKTCL
mmetsp:Transcript_66414/g.191749  ORF Transcript_66414/g.191749 Transcript_66414/m.191749 type:complete len:252 (+) Transcript_66414:322-1077(+)